MSQTKRRRGQKPSLEITIADVAREAGVSIPTVSRIVNNKPYVSEPTKARVEAAIQKLGYVPHSQAQRLRAGKTRNIALLFPVKHASSMPYNPLETDFILGAAAAAGENQYFFNLLTTPIDEQNLLGLYRSSHVDGVVLMQIHAHDWRVELLRQHSYPFVMIGHCEDNTGLSYIDLDFDSTVQAAFDHVVSLGHRHVGFLALPAELRQAGYGPAARGWQGYQKALRTHGLTPLQREVSYVGQAIYEATLELIDEQPELTAIVTTHELAALSVIQALNTRGRSVPDDCSLIALMSERIAERSTPPLTHMDFPSYHMGYNAVQILIRRLEAEADEPEQILIPPRLVIRDSTAPVRGE